MTILLIVAAGMTLFTLACLVAEACDDRVSVGPRPRPVTGRRAHGRHRPHVGRQSAHSGPPSTGGLHGALGSRCAR